MKRVRFVTWPTCGSKPSPSTQLGGKVCETDALEPVLAGSSNKAGQTQDERFRPFSARRLRNPFSGGGPAKVTEISFILNRLDFDTAVPPGPISPLTSFSVSSELGFGRPPKKRRSRSDDSYASDINTLGESFRQSIVVAKSNSSLTASKPDTIDGLIAFIGSMLRSFQSEEL
uniref:Uncharacterized protein n=1 Tax=Timema tahoe TaxID=61484 RepID=A0A7R9FEV4_9NEOP|nr:unnamed protein product [Timema tahoe]